MIIILKQNATPAQLNELTAWIEKQNLKRDIKGLLLNPSIIAVIIGIIIMVFNIQLPRSLLSSMKSIGNTTGPLSMIIIGGIISKVNIKTYLKDWTIYYGIIIKLIIIPIIIYLVFLIVGISSKAINAVIIMTAMPASAMTSILAEKYNKEKEYAAILVSVTTLLSLITIPLLLRIIM